MAYVLNGRSSAMHSMCTDTARAREWKRVAARVCWCMSKKMLCYKPKCMPYIERKRGDTIVSVSVTFVLSLEIFVLLLLWHIQRITYGSVSNSDGDSYFSSISSVRDSCCVSRKWRSVIILRLNSNSLSSLINVKKNQQQQQSQQQ